MKALHISLIAVMSLGLSAAAFARGSDDIRLQMRHGNYAAAYVAAENLGTADGYALAAEILLSEIMLGEAEKNKKQAKRARKLAEAGLELEPENQNARLQYAIADGFITRETGDVSAWMKKLPQKTHAIVEAYRTDFPQDPRGDALLGAWHLAIVRKAGNKNAEKWFGASISQGRALFQNARMVEPQNIIISVNYAFSLLALDTEDFSDTAEARQILEAVLAAQPEDNLGHVLQTYAGETLKQIEDRDITRDYVGLFLDGKRPSFE